MRVRVPTKWELQNVSEHGSGLYNISCNLQVIVFRGFIPAMRFYRCAGVFFSKFFG
jgi:hypothetical protein